jgi:heptosyltransferase-1
VSAETRGDSPQSLLVVRLGAMGDVIHTMAAVATLRAALPGMKIGWAVEERWAELLRAKSDRGAGPRSAARPLVDSVHVLDSKRWRRSLFAAETRTQLAGVFRSIRAERYAVTTDFQGAIKSALVARFSGAQQIVGMAHPREAPARLLYGKRVNTTGSHVIEQYHSLAQAIVGRALPAVAPEFPYDAEAEATITAKFGAHQRNIAILNPGAGWAAKQWPAERYGEVARALAGNGMLPVINFGPGEDELARAAEAASAGSAASISCSISELIALTRRARLFIGGDTGPLHLAAALKVPVVALFGPTDPARNGPYGTQSIVLRNAASRTSLSHTSAPDPGLLQITVDEVIRAARQLLEEANA